MTNRTLGIFLFFKISEIFASLGVCGNPLCKNEWLNLSSSGSANKSQNSLQNSLTNPSGPRAFLFCKCLIPFNASSQEMGAMRSDCCSFDIVRRLVLQPSKPMFDLILRKKAISKNAQKLDLTADISQQGGRRGINIGSFLALSSAINILCFFCLF